MTQDMTNPELNRALAELMGYKVVKTGEGEYAYELQDATGVCVNSDGRGWESEEYAWAGTPCYTSDPAASLEVQTAAIDLNAREYIRNLQELKWECSFSGISMKRIADLLNASPRERAEAAYITLQGQ